MASLYAVVVAAALVGTHQETPLQELGDIMVGRWIGDVKLVADWPGLGKRGEKVTAYVSIDWVIDGQAFEINWHGGEGTSRELITWDAATKTIRSLGAASGGRSWQGTWKKQGNQWFITSEGSLADGTKVGGGQNVMTPVDDGARVVFTNQGDGFIGDQKLDPLHDVYVRLNDEGSVDTPLQELGDLLVGRWMGDIELMRDWPGVGTKGERIVEYATFQWTNDHRAILRKSHGGAACGMSITVWDAAEKKIREFATNSGGASFTALMWKEGDGWAWSLTGSLHDGRSQTGSGKVIFAKDGQTYQVIGDLDVGGEKMSFVDPYRRLAQ